MNSCNPDSDTSSYNTAATKPQPPLDSDDLDDGTVADNQSTTSSTDDYVRELLDPNDRPRNVWRVVEGPKLEAGDEGEAAEDAHRVADDQKTYESQSHSPIPSPPPPPPPPEEEQQQQQEGDVKVETVAAAAEGELHDDARRSPRSVGGSRTSEKGHSDRPSSSSRHHRHHDDHREQRDRDTRDRHRDRDRDGNRDRDSERDRDRSHRRDRSKRSDRDDYRSSKRRRDHSDDDDQDVGGHRSHRRQYSSRSSHRRDRSGSRTSSSRRRDRSRSNSHSPLTKRNSRTILIMQLNPRVTSGDLEEFFAPTGKVKEVRLIIDSKTRKHKGIAYIEFEDTSSAAKAFAMNGQEFFGAPINIQSAHLDRGGGGGGLHRSSGDWHLSSSSHSHHHHNNNNNSVSNYHHHASTHSSSRSNLPPNCYRVYVGGLHVNLTEEMLRSLFEPFGPILRLELMRDRATNISRGYAFITYANMEDGQEAVRCLDGFELVGKPMRVSKSTDKSERHHTATDPINAG